jgi:hypothetical protein
LCSQKGKISEKFCFERINLGILDSFCPSLKTRAQLEERRFDLSRSNRSTERYVIPMHRKNVWTNKWMMDPRKNFLQVSYCDSSCSTGKVGDHLKERED